MCFISSSNGSEDASLLYNDHAVDGLYWIRADQLVSLPACASVRLVCSKQKVFAVCRHLPDRVKLVMEALGKNVELSESGEVTVWLRAHQVIIKARSVSNQRKLFTDRVRRCDTSTRTAELAVDFYCVTPPSAACLCSLAEKRADRPTDPCMWLVWSFVCARRVISPPPEAELTLLWVWVGPRLHLSSLLLVLKSWFYCQQPHGFTVRQRCYEWN